MATVTLKGTPFHTMGELPAIGTQCPNFTLTRQDLGELRLSDCIGKKTILNIFPSLDTPTCATSVRRFNESAAQQPNLLVLCVSADLPFAQKRFCVTEHIDNVVPVSVFRNTDFGKHFGNLITDGPLAGLLARSIIAFDETGKITYTQLVTEIADEPDYDAALKA